MRLPAKPAIVLCLLLLNIVLQYRAQAQKLSSKEHDKKLEGLSEREKVDYIITNHYALYSADYDHALQLNREAGVISKRNQWKDKEAYAEMFQGVIYFLKGDFKSSLPRYLRAYSLFDSLQDYHGLARLCNEMGVFYARNKNHEKSKEYFLKGEAFAIQSGNKEQLGTSLGHQGTMLEREGKISEAEKLYERVYQIRLETKDSVGLGYALLDKANMEMRANNVTKALAYLELATEIRKKIGDEQGVAINMVNIGETYLSIKNYRKAIDYFQQSLPLAIETGYVDLIRYTYEQLAATNVALNNFKEAYAYQQKSKTFNDSLFNIEKEKVVADLQTKYETEKKEQQIVLQQAVLTEREAEITQTYIIIAALIVVLILLSIIFLLIRSRYKRNQQLLQREKELSVQEAYITASIHSQENERKRFAQDLHDGMGQLISALRLSLLSIHRDTPIEQRVEVVGKAEDLLNDMHREIRSIAFNLMPHTLVQHGLVPALKEMAERVSGSGHVVIRIESFDVPARLNELQEVSLYRIIQEWINNVIKYSGAKLIEVQLVRHESELTITVEDNGNGFDNKVLENSPGNGWKNIRSRMNLIKGLIEIDSQPGRRGTTVILRVPLREPVEVPDAITGNLR